METDTIQRVLRARYGGVEASDVLVQFVRIELERPDALAWIQNGKFFEIYGDAARLLGRLLDLRVAEKPLMTGRDRQPVTLAMTGITIGSEREPYFIMLHSTAPKPQRGAQQIRGDMLQ